ncbi:Fatty acid synthesis protein [Dethiosulfatibacter aminovorans DSM 17477]|uniref:Fatty acid synthesis protein n=1 Tax=Dethiosulfatibacter aminovorans DSM 17477 TaxID=1121476 RepID=A0A1M6BIC7_9FIRM|nr:glycine/sarcosine/betaine reductase complex component C subunit alpha [Dethiosulfatibacter aminovorans]SHI48338.1 Fatty acid synthesis protein [Dethiosulfatibacter aminovorans DSM 17477]
MEEKKIKQLIGKTMLEIAEAIETGSFGQKTRVGITILGSEHGSKNLIDGAVLAARNNPDMEVVLIGPKNDSGLETVEVDSEEEMHTKMEELLDSNHISACVTMHYNFPIGVSTVGKVFTPGMGKEMYLATTTGTSSVHRSEAMVKNALHGIITAKSMGLENPTVGILNLDGARQVERALKDLDSRGYAINFAESMRSDGGSVMRGNDLLCGTADVMVTDTLTGNIMMKVFSSFTTGGSYEASGFGYGPGIGEDYERTILILSRASGIPVVANALAYAKDLAKGRLAEKSRTEFQKAKKSGLDEILDSLKETKKAAETAEEVKMPEKETVTGQIAGIDIMDLEDAVQALWKEGIYAESGMGCTGPIVRVNEDKMEDAVKALVKAEFLAG